MIGILFLLFSPKIAAINLPCYRHDDELIVEMTGTQTRKNATAFKHIETENAKGCINRCLYENTCVSMNAIQEGESVNCELFDIDSYNKSLTADIKSSYYEVDLLCRYCSKKGVRNKCACDCSIKRDCVDWLKAGFNQSGVYEIIIKDKLTKVFCDMETNGGGWIRFQNRFDDSVDFNKPWTDYKYGFGDIEGEFWLGLENVHYLTSNGDHLLYMEMLATTNERITALYSNFQIQNEASYYKLMYSACVSGKCDGVNQHQYQPFSTYDRNDHAFLTTCPEIYSGGWWYNGCYDINLNGRPKHKWRMSGVFFYLTANPAKTVMMLKRST